MYLLGNNNADVIGYQSKYRRFSEWHKCRTAALDAGALRHYGRGLFDQPPTLGEATRVSGGPSRIDITAMHIGVE